MENGMDGIGIANAIDGTLIFPIPGIIGIDGNAGNFGGLGMENGMDGIGIASFIEGNDGILHLLITQ